MLKKLVLVASALAFGSAYGTEAAIPIKSNETNSVYCPLGGGFYCPDGTLFCTFPPKTCWVKKNELLSKVQPLKEDKTETNEVDNVQARWCPLGGGFWCPDNCPRCSFPPKRCLCVRENEEEYTVEGKEKLSFEN